MNQTTLILGGTRSGKSRHAETLLQQNPAPWLYLATGRAWDAEMQTRIETHKSRRPKGWQTHETPIDLTTPLKTHPNTPALVDCLTLWLTNLLLEEHDIPAHTISLLETLTTRTAPTILVGSEVGLGIVPENALARRFRDEAGLLHQTIAQYAHHVFLCVAGYPLAVK